MLSLLRSSLAHIPAVLIRTRENNKSLKRRAPILAHDKQQPQYHSYICGTAAVMMECNSLVGRGRSTKGARWVRENEAGKTTQIRARARGG